MIRELSNQRVLITDVSSCLGRTLAIKAAQRGARLLLAGPKTSPLEALADAMKQHGADTLAVPADVTSQDDRSRLLQTAVDSFGGLDILINNAALVTYGHFADSTEEILRYTMEVNFFAPAELIRSAIPLLTQGNQPAVVLVASVCGHRGLPNWPDYSSSQSAIRGLAEALRAEMARFDIDLITIISGMAKSDFHDDILGKEGPLPIGLEKEIDDDPVATTILNAIAGHCSETVIGKEAKRVLRLHKFFPRFLDWVLKRRARQRNR